MWRRNSTLSPIAVDFGARCVKLIQFDLSGPTPTLVGAAWRPVPPTSSEAEREQAIRAAAADALHSGAFRGRRAVAALQPGEFLLKSVRLPRMPGEELDGAVQFEAEERFGFGADAGQFRYVLTGDVRQGNEVKEELIVFGVRESAARTALARLESLRLEPAALDAAPCATARSFARFLRRQADTEAVNVFIDVGHGGTSLVITRGPSPAFVKVIDVGGRQLDAAVAGRLGAPPEQADEIRTALMQSMVRGGRRRSDAAETAMASSVGQQVADAERPAVEQLMKEVLLCLRYFTVTFRGHKPGSVTFVGGAAHDPSLLGLFSEILDVPCLVGDPLRGVNAAGGASMLGHAAFRPAWATAVGLALHGAACEAAPAASATAGAA